MGGRGGAGKAPRLRYCVAMDPARKRRVRLVVALSAAVVLAAALVYTSFSASSEARTPSQLLASADPGRTYQLTGKVVDGSIEKNGTTYEFRVRDRDGTASVPIRYTGSVADTFRAGREVIVTVKRQGATFVGEKDSLVTKCPSKFQEQSKTQKT
jgi:cytochrome c-type biogenesis protein CcmE